MNFKRFTSKKMSEEKTPEKSDTSSSGDITVVGDNVYFFCDVDAKTCRDLIVKLSELDAIPTNDPVKLHILSDGGCVMSALAVVGTIKNMKREVHSYVSGAAISAGTIISVVCDKRLMYENSYMLIHQVSSMFMGTFSEYVDEWENMTKLMDDLKSLYEENSKMIKEDLDKILKHDLYFSSRRCLELGLVDEVIVNKSKRTRKRKRTFTTTEPTTKRRRS